MCHLLSFSFADTIITLNFAISEKFTIGLEYGWETFNRDRDNFVRLENPVYRDCILNLVRAYDGLRNYALGFKAQEVAS